MKEGEEVEPQKIDMASSDWKTLIELLRKKVIKAEHGTFNRSAEKVLRHLTNTWYWPKMSRDVWRVVNQCDHSSNTKVAAPRGRGQSLGVRPWKRIGIHVARLLPKTEHSNSWILTVMDPFTRWQDGIALPSPEADEVALVLNEREFCYFGVPETIHINHNVD